MNEDELKYLDFLQGTISRLAGNSFQLKGWSAALGSVIIGLTAKDSQPNLAWLALVPICAFWLLDAYYLTLERMYREKWIQAVPALRANEHLLSPESTVYDMNVGNVSLRAWLSAALSRSVAPVHGALALVAIGVMLWGILFFKHCV